MEATISAAASGKMASPASSRMAKPVASARTMNHPSRVQRSDRGDWIRFLQGGVSSANWATATAPARTTHTELTFQAEAMRETAAVVTTAETKIINRI